MADLEKRSLGKTGMKAIALGLGCAHLGHPNKATDGEAIEAVRHAIDLGINFVDTSAMYGHGHSERRVGLALEGGYRDKVYLQTKAGTHPERRHDYSAEAIRWSVENSFKQLRTDYIDSVLIHDPREKDDPFAAGAGWEELLKMKEEGLVGHIGIGVRSDKWHQVAIETGQADIVLTPGDYNLLSQSLVETSWPLAKAQGVGVIIGSVFAIGLLAGAEPNVEDEKRRYPGEPRAYAMWQWCEDRGVNIRHLAMQFCLAAPIESIVLSGPANKREVIESFESATEVVADEIWDEFEKAFGVGIK